MITRTISEAIALYKLEPSMRDIFVEGPGDVAYLKWYLQCESISSVEIRAIEFIDFEEVQLPNSKRDRIVRLARILDDHGLTFAAGVACIADCDADVFYGHSFTSARLIYTDCSSIDLYSFSCDSLAKIWALGIARVWDHDSTLSATITDILRRAYVARAASHHLNLGVSFEGRLVAHCEIQGQDIIFDWNKYLLSALATVNRQGEYDHLVAECNQLLNMPISDIRQVIHKSDLFSLIGVCLSKTIGTGGSVFRNPAVVRAIIIPLAEIHTLRKERLFSLLSSWYRA